MLKTARGSLPNSTIDAIRSGSADNLPLPPTRSASSTPAPPHRLTHKYFPLPASAQRVVDARHKEDQLHEARALDNIAETVDPVVAGTIGHQQLGRAGDVAKTGIGAASR